MDAHTNTNEDWRSTLAELITKAESSGDKALLGSLRQRLSNPDLLNKKQAADFLTIAVRTLDDWRQAKIIPCITLGGYIRFQREDLEAFLASHRLEARKSTPYRPRRRKSAAPAP